MILASFQTRLAQEALQVQRHRRATGELHAQGLQAMLRLVRLAIGLRIRQQRGQQDAHAHPHEVVT